jgi:membrane protein
MSAVPAAEHPTAPLPPVKAPTEGEQTTPPPPRTAIQVVRRAFEVWTRADASRTAASLAYFTTFSLAPLIILVTVIAGLIFDQTAVRAQILRSLQSDLGPDAAQLLGGVIDQMSQPRDSIVSTVVSIVALLLGAIGVFANLQGALDRIWGVSGDQVPGGIRGFLLSNLVSLGMVLAVGFLLLVSLIISTVLSALTAGFNSFMPGSDWLLNLANVLISFGVITVLFALMFRILPHAPVSWRDVWWGAALTSLFFTLGKTLLSLYLATSGTASVYGAAGSLVAVLVWIYYAAQILLMGAAVTRATAERNRARTADQT